MSLEVNQVADVVPHWTLLGADGSVSGIKSITVAPDTAGVADVATMKITWGADVVAGVVVSVTGANMSDGSGDLVISSAPFDLVAAPVVATPTADGGTVEVI